MDDVGINRLLDILPNLRQVFLHVFFIASIDDLDNFFHLASNLFHLSFRIGVEEDFTQKSVIFGEDALSNLHVTLESRSRGILVLHYGSKGKGGYEGDG